MSRRTLASTVVALLLVVLVAMAAVLPVPYVTMSPGPTVDVFGKRGDQPIIAVSGHRTYPTEGDLRLTTVSVTNPTRQVGLVEVLKAWVDKTRAVYPREAIYPSDQSAEDVEQQSSVEMVSSQDTAVAAALSELGYRLPLQIEVLAVSQGSPSEGRLKVRDKITAIDGARVTSTRQDTDAVQQAGAGTPVRFEVRRGSRTSAVTVRPRVFSGSQGKARVGVQIGTGYDFPFDVSVRLGEDIGGPSAGLVFSLGVYDRLTPGSLTGGNHVAGTGTIDERGRVGPIGGIQQKIVAAADAGAKVFLVPPGNCGEAEAADVTEDQIRLVKAPTMHSAVESLRAYARDHDARLPACG